MNQHRLRQLFTSYGGNKKVPFGVDDNETEVYIKVFMANGMYYNFEADSSIEKTMYVYLPDDMDNAVDCDSYPSIYSRVVDFDEYDESGYAYVKLVSSSGASLGTITCTLAAAPMGY